MNVFQRKFYSFDFKKRIDIYRWAYEMEEYTFLSIIHKYINPIQIKKIRKLCYKKVLE